MNSFTGTYIFLAEKSFLVQSLLLVKNREKGKKVERKAYFIPCYMYNMESIGNTVKG